MIASLDLFREPQASPREVSSYVGTVQWFDLLNRWLLSCLDETYGFDRADPQERQQRVLDPVLSELMHNFAMSPFWEADLCRPWCKQLVATDASPSFGFGVAAASVPFGIVKKIGRQSHRRDTFVRLDREEGDPLEKPHVGSELCVPVKLRDSRTVMSVK